MNQNELKHLHEVLLFIVDEINRICEKNNIKYSLVDGSLLGAVRHKGFIPWDDDIDIGMLRKDYEKFISACEKDLDKRFILQTNLTDPYYMYGFCKILLKDTFLVQFGHEKTKHKKGIYVDIFPYDNVPSDNIKRKKQAWKNFILKHLLSRKFGVSTGNIKNPVKKIIFWCGDFVGLFIKKESLIRKLNQNVMLYSDCDCIEYVSSMSGYYGYNKETIPVKYFDKVIRVPFEDRMYPILSEYDGFLTRYYGDYMQLPPLEERKTHGFKSLDFGPY